MEYNFNNILRLTDNKAQVIQLMILNHNFRKLIGLKEKNINKMFLKIIQPGKERILTVKDMIARKLILKNFQGYYSIFNSGNINELRYEELLYEQLPFEIKYYYIKYLSKLQRYAEKKLNKKLIPEKISETLEAFNLITSDDNYIYFVKEYDKTLDKLQKEYKRKTHSPLGLEVIDYEIN